MREYLMNDKQPLVDEQDISIEIMELSEEEAIKQLEGLELDKLEINNLDDVIVLLEEDINKSKSDRDALKVDVESLKKPEEYSKVIMDVVWEQFSNQIGLNEGDHFIEENNGHTMDLRDSAHIQTTENFKAGKIATHNTEIDYQTRYDEYQKNFRHGPEGMPNHKNYRVDETTGRQQKYDSRSGKYKDVLTKDARKDYDKNRPTGNASKNTAMDHTISTAEIIRDDEAAAHMSHEEKVEFANSEDNLREMDAAQNQSKGDSTMEEWHESERDGKKVPERFGMSDETVEKQKQDYEHAEKQFEKKKKEAVQRSIESGKKSQRNEAIRAGKAALKGTFKQLFFSMLKDLLTKVGKQLIQWLKGSEKNLSDLWKRIKYAINQFFKNIKQHLKSAGEGFLITVGKMIWGPIVNTITSIWSILKQAAGIIKRAYSYLTDPGNKNKPWKEKLVAISQMIVTALTGMGAIALGQTITVGLSTVPALAFEIPLLGSLASIIGIFLGATIAGVIGAIIVNKLNKMLSKSVERDLVKSEIAVNEDILSKQLILKEVVQENTSQKRNVALHSIAERHVKAHSIREESVQTVLINESDHQKSSKSIQNMQADIDELIKQL